MHSQIIPSCVKQKQKNPCSSSKTSDCKRHRASSTCLCEDSAVGSHLPPPLEAPEPVKGLGLCAGNSRKEFIHSSAWACCLELSTGFLLPVVCPCAPGGVSMCSQWCVHVPPCPRPRLCPSSGGCSLCRRCELGCGVSPARDLPRATPQTAPAAAAALLTRAWQFLLPALLAGLLCTLSSTTGVG